MKPLRVLLVDDQRLFASSLKQVLEAHKAEIQRVVIAPDGEKAIELIDEVHPYIVLMDTHMPKVDGIEATRRIHAKHPELTILMLSAFGYEDYVRDAMAVGASGYLLKDITPEELVDSIRSAIGGTVVLSPQVLQGVSPIADRSRIRHESDGWFRELTHSERLILLLVSKGYSNTEISQRLNLGPQTVRNYVSGVYAKMGARDRFEAIRMAIEAGITSIVEEEPQG